MPTSDPLDILLAHNLWANRQMLAACGGLTPEQFHRRFEMGPGSVHDTMTHIVAATRVWADRLATREQRPRLEGTVRSVAELSALLDDVSAEIAVGAQMGPMNALVEMTRQGQSLSLTRGGILMHVTTHAMHHRAQCLNMMRQLGVSPLPLSSVVEWIRTVDGA